MKPILALSAACIPVVLAALAGRPSPTLDSVLPDGLEDVQTMTTGQVDFWIPGAATAPSPADGSSPVVCLDGPADPSPAPPSGGPPANPPATGFTLLSPDGQPLDNVALGQPFHLELRVLPGEAAARSTIPVTLRTGDGDEDTVVLERTRGEPGVIVYRTPQPVSIGGRAGRMRYDGTVDGLGLNFGTGTEVHVVRLGAAGLLGGSSAVRVFANPIQQAIDANREMLDRVDDVLKAQRQTAEGLLADPEVARDAAVGTEVNAWLERIGKLERLLAEARQYIDKAPFPIYQLRYSNLFLKELLTSGPNGLQLVEEAPTDLVLSNKLGTLARELRGEYGTNGIVPPAAMATISGYVVGGTTTFAHLTMAAAFNQLATGKDLFGNEASRGWAVLEIGIGVAAFVLPARIFDFVASRGINNLGLEISVGGRGARLVLPGRGLATSEAAFWRQKAVDGAPASFKARLAQEADNVIAQMDEAVAAGRRNGVPQDVIDGLLAQARSMDITKVGDFLAREVSFAVARKQGGPIFISPDDMAQMAEWFGPEHMAQMTRCNVGLIDGIAAKAHLEVSGKPQLWTPDEIQILRTINRRMDQGESFSGWKKAELIEQKGPGGKIESFIFDGFQPVFGSGDLGAIRAAVARPLRIDPSAPVTPSGPAVTPPRSATPAVNPVLQPAAISGPSGRSAGASQVEMVIRSTGGSTGDVMEALLVNYGGPILLRADGLVLEPADPGHLRRESKRLDEIYMALAERGFLEPPAPPPEGKGDGYAEPRRGAAVLRFSLDAYCLEFLKAVPAAGTVFRIAGLNAQERNGRTRAILAASRQLRDSPAAYVHSIRQWAIWVDERKLGQKEFEADFLRHARRNFEAAGQAWTGEVERAVRERIPGRWRDVERVLKG